MLKKTLLTILILVVVSGLGAGYLYHVGKGVRAQRAESVCSGIDIRVRDSIKNRLIDCEDILALLQELPSRRGMKVDSVDTHSVEQYLDTCGEVLKSEVYMLKDGTMRVEVTQRCAAVRFLGDDGLSCYCDVNGYIFPVKSIVDVPLVTGCIPIKADDGFKGFCNDPKGKEWIGGIIRLTDYIERHDYWRRLISQVDVENDGDIALYPIEGGIKILFGDCSQADDKFSRIAKYYKCIAPLKKDKPCSEVSVKYRNQIICR